MSATDFDFLHGRWHVHHRKIADIAGRGTEWVEFPATTEVWPVLGGIGTVENMVALDFEGMPLRLYDTERDVWRIWWASTRQPGHLDPPVEGGFADGHGVFLGEDVVGGQPVRVRFDWTPGETPVWGAVLLLRRRRHLGEELDHDVHPALHDRVIAGSVRCGVLTCAQSPPDQYGVVVECEEDPCTLCQGSGTMYWKQPVPGPEGLVLHEMSHPCPRGCSGWWRLPAAERAGVVAGNCAQANELEHPAGSV